MDKMILPTYGRKLNTFVSKNKQCKEIFARFLTKEEMKDH